MNNVGIEQHCSVSGKPRLAHGMLVQTTAFVGAGRDGVRVSRRILVCAQRGVPVAFNQFRRFRLNAPASQRPSDEQPVRRAGGAESVPPRATLPGSTFPALLFSGGGGMDRTSFLPSEKRQQVHQSYPRLLGRTSSRHRPQLLGLNVQTLRRSAQFASEFVTIVAASVGVNVRPAACPPSPCRSAVTRAFVPKRFAGAFCSWSGGSCSSPIHILPGYSPRFERPLEISERSGRKTVPHGPKNKERRATAKPSSALSRCLLGVFLASGERSVLSQPSRMTVPRCQQARASLARRLAHSSIVSPQPSGFAGPVCPSCSLPIAHASPARRQPRFANGLTAAMRLHVLVFVRTAFRKEPIQSSRPPAGHGSILAQLRFRGRKSAPVAESGRRCRCRCRWRLKPLGPVLFVQARASIGFVLRLPASIPEPGGINIRAASWTSVDAGGSRLWAIDDAAANSGADLCVRKGAQCAPPGVNLKSSDRNTTVGTSWVPRRLWQSSWVGTGPSTEPVLQMRQRRNPTRTVGDLSRILDRPISDNLLLPLRHDKNANGPWGFDVHFVFVL
ncbi:hypothetical protein H6P81_016357 [Aristolochia fimbriata]|uniref:Uncharacterized protein n=1 Tax=Aristolochia fimbriata TaxID=158543 RepID=A0AAV7EBV2_ARIFI|nr:hypothetical protein H6P81_016357 [Aristolochia fimbriata]